MSTQKQNGPTEMEILIGGIDAEVSLRNQTTETVKIRLLAIEDYPQLMKSMDSEPAMVELYCGKPEGWANGLTMPSLEGVIGQGERLNMDFFSRWVHRRLGRQEILIGIREKIIEKGLSALQDSPPKSPSNAA